MDEMDFRTYLSFLAEYQIKHSFRLYACALMKSHIPPHGGQINSFGKSVWARYPWLFGEEIDGFVSERHCPAFSK